MFKLALDWLLRSSKDPAKMATSVKGALLYLVPLVIIIAPMFGVNLKPDGVDTFINDIAEVVKIFFTIVSAGTTFYGLARKIYLSVTGKNEVLILAGITRMK